MTEQTVVAAADAPPSRWHRSAEFWPALTVPANAQREWLELQEALVGVTPPCRADPEGWHLTSTRRRVDAERQAVAVEACGWCPVRVECAAYGVAAGEEGIWGGLTVADRQARRQTAS